MTTDDERRQQNIKQATQKITKSYLTNNKLSLDKVPELIERVEKKLSAIYNNIHHKNNPKRPSQD